MSSALLALSLISHFDCASLDGLNIYAQVEVINKEIFEVRLSNDGMEMPVYQKRLGFDELGELNEVETSAWWERFHITRSEDYWEGEYWNDNHRSQLICTKHEG